MVPVHWPNQIASTVSALFTVEKDHVDDSLAGTHLGAATDTPERPVPRPRLSLLTPARYSNVNALAPLHFKTKKPPFSQPPSPHTVPSHRPLTPSPQPITSTPPCYLAPFYHPRQPPPPLLAMSFFGRAPRQEGAPARSKVMHGLKVTMSPATSKREITESDESHRVTQQTLATWKAALRALHDALATNEAAWKNLFASFTTFSTAAAAVYSATDIESRAVVKALESARTAVEAPPTDPGYTPMQKVEFARQELAAMLSRIQNAEALHAKRLETTRQYKYYDRKTKQMLENEAKPGKTVSVERLERRTRNQKNVMDLAIQLNSITTQLYTELDTTSTSSR
ncbi:unnamed protein product [Chondrus crispus]|uniref:Uncharacterized protein n=1 Tax=Chondrus crispus TaxID=2769 RepID=R7QQJ1_CHOCR|nr:unnamed protein product [Chondrus crispus]CDF39655.1 unnamed protein product [Chondrus crispus]|eukprot:XP_005709949.1 unnamed protein product [Chondrus crispus]